MLIFKQSLALAVALVLASAASGVETVAAGLEIDAVREGPWLRVSYRFKNTTGKRIGSGSVRCVASNAEGAAVARASDRVAHADVPFGVQLGVILLNVGDADVTPKCDVGVYYWLVDGAYDAAAPGEGERARPDEPEATPTSSPAPPIGRASGGTVIGSPVTGSPIPGKP